MKSLILFVALVSAGSLAVLGQTGEKPVVKKTVPPTRNFEREKFDPLRNPADDLQSAVARAQKEEKRIIMDVGGEWCVWCIQMDKYLFMNPSLAKIRDANFIWLKVNMSEENENREFLGKYPEIKGYPHLFVLEKDGTLLFSQDTSELEEGNSYNLQKFTDFLTKWSPSAAKNAGTK